MALKQISRETLNRSILTAVFALSIGIHQAGFAKEVFKWVDETGKVHYSDKKPTSDQSTVESIKLRVAPSSPNAVNSRSRILDNADKLNERKSKELEKKAEQLQAKSEENQRASICEKAKSNLKTLSENGRVRVKGEDGELRYLTPEEMDERKKQFEELVEANC